MARVDFLIALENLHRERRKMKSLNIFNGEHESSIENKSVTHEICIEFKIHLLKRDKLFFCISHLIR